MFDNVTNVEEVLLVCSYSRMMVEQQSLPCYAYQCIAGALLESFSTLPRPLSPPRKNGKPSSKARKALSLRKRESSAPAFRGVPAPHASRHGPTKEANLLGLR